MKYYIFLSTLSKENKWSPYKKIECVNDIKSARNIYRIESERLRKLYDDYYADKFDIIIGRLNKLEESKVYLDASKLEQENKKYKIDILILKHCSICSNY